MSLQSTGARIAIAVAAVAVVVVLFIVLSAGDDEERTTAETTAPAREQADKPEEEGRPAKKPKPEETATEIQVRGGQPVGGVEKIETTVDEPVRIVVSSPDTTEEVHVHGYDEIAELSPEKPAKLGFDASIEGVFEIELEHAHVQIAELTVEP